jgi:hypothetical protein
MTTHTPESAAPRSRSSGRSGDGFAAAPGRTRKIDTDQFVAPALTLGSFAMAWSIGEIEWTAASTGLVFSVARGVDPPLFRVDGYAIASAPVRCTG